MTTEAFFIFAKTCLSQPLKK